MEPLQPEKKRITESAADRLRLAILRGEYPAGSDLPAERELSVRLGVSRLTLRAALTRLEAEQLVHPVHGSGTRVLDYRDSAGVDVLAHLVVLALEGGAPASLLGDVLELRRVVAIECVGLAVERATDADLDAIDAGVEALEPLVDAPPHLFMKRDIALAALLVRATHNFALVLLANTIVRILERQPGIELAFAAQPKLAVRVYRRIAQIVRARDAKRARRFTRLLLGRLDREVVRTFAVMGPSQHLETGSG